LAGTEKPAEVGFQKTVVFSEQEDKKELELELAKEEGTDKQCNATAKGEEEVPQLVIRTLTLNGGKIMGKEPGES